MRKLLVSLFVLTLTIGLQAQEKQEMKSNSNKWIITAGANIVDIRTPKNLGEMFKDYIGPRDMNFSGIPLKVTVERSLNKAFSMQIGASMNKIQKGFGWNEGDFKTDILFLGLDGKLKYDLNDLIGQTGAFDPFIETGFGVTEYDHQAMVNLKAGWGFNFWLGNRVGLNFNSTYNHNFEDSGNDYFQHSLGLAYRFTTPNDETAYVNHKVNESSKWLISFGVNFLDVRTPNDFKGFFKDYFNGYIEDVNAYGFPFRATVERKLNDAFGVQLGFSMGDLKKGFGYEKTHAVANEKYWAVDLKGTYDVNNLIGETAWFDPFINLGIGYSKLADKSDFKVNAGYGANFWLFENVGIKAESSYNHHFQPTGTDFFQHSAGLVYRFGATVKDTDKDGVFDEEDACPKVAGELEFKGCPDTDGDGIPDNEDKCPKVKGVKANNGCPWADTDGDGVTDNLDKCPKVKGLKSNNGCPEVKKEEVKVEKKEFVSPKANSECLAEINEINSTEVYFDTNKTVIKRQAKAKLNRVAEILKSMKCSVELVFLSGYADPRGSSSYNLGLSNRRAIAVKRYLQSVGVTNVTIKEEGFGETHSRKQNRFNRRVEIRIK